MIIRQQNYADVGDYVVALYEGLYEFCFLELTTGSRLGEILALEWSDPDENQKVICVNKSARRGEGRGQADAI